MDILLTDECFTYFSVYSDLNPSAQAPIAKRCKFYTNTVFYIRGGLKLLCESTRIPENTTTEACAEVTLLIYICFKIRKTFLL